MASNTIDQAIKPRQPVQASTSKAWEIAFCLHMSACRFGSPAGIAFLPQSYLPFLAAKKT